MARNARKNYQDSIEAVDPTKPLSAGAELQLIGLQCVWRQAPEIAIFSSRIHRLRRAARVNGTQLADELVREAKRNIYHNKVMNS
jgi:hypothetical protein